MFSHAPYHINSYRVVSTHAKGGIEGPHRVAPRFLVAKGGKIDISKVPKRLRDCEALRRSRALTSALNRGPTEYDQAGDLQSLPSDTIARGLSFALVAACEGEGLRQRGRVEC